jgi:hypothetical protein
MLNRGINIRSFKTTTVDIGVLSIQWLSIAVVNIMMLNIGVVSIQRLSIAAVIIMILNIRAVESRGKINRRLLNRRRIKILSLKTSMCQR